VSKDKYVKDDGPKKKPKTLIRGIFYGTGRLVHKCVDGVAGVFVEPYKGAKDGGAKGAAIGVGKGLVGLVAKPVSGVVEFGQHTVQGAVNTPTTWYNRFVGKP